MKNLVFSCLIFGNFLTSTNPLPSTNEILQPSPIEVKNLVGLFKSSLNVTLSRPKMSSMTFSTSANPLQVSTESAVKDQTYFLSHLSQKQLKRLLFPLGCISKDEVRRLATLMDLPNKDRKDSQGICFLGKVKFSEFVAKHIGEQDGIILEAETGDYLGDHRGFWFYTVGQRQGLRLPGGPWYVVEKDVQNNVVFVSRNYYSLDKKRRKFRAGTLKWISGSPPKNSQLRCKVRHGPSFHNCSITMESDDAGYGEVVTVDLSEDDQGLAAGQFAAFYDGDSCIGSGVILDSWDDKSFAICAKALEIAQLQDKSKLGKPVRILNQETADCKR